MYYHIIREWWRDFFFLLCRRPIFLASFSFCCCCVGFFFSPYFYFISSFGRRLCVPCFYSLIFFFYRRPTHNLTILYMYRRVVVFYPRRKLRCSPQSFISFSHNNNNKTLLKCYTMLFPHIELKGISIRILYIRGREEKGENLFSFFLRVGYIKKGDSEMEEAAATDTPLFDVTIHHRKGFIAAAGSIFFSPFLDPSFFWGHSHFYLYTSQHTRVVAFFFCVIECCCCTTTITTTYSCFLFSLLSALFLTDALNTRKESNGHRCPAELILFFFLFKLFQWPLLDEM